MKSFKKISFLTAFFALFLTFSVSGAFAQVNEGENVEAQPETYTLTGEVVDWESSEALANAQVMVAGSSELSTTTNQEGMFTLNLPAGTHTVKVKLDGYQTWKKEVEVNADKQIKVKLKPEIK